MSYIGSHYDLPSLENEMTGSAVVNLPQIPHHFFVPRLANKPQNPITDTLKQTSTKTTLPTRPPFHTLPPEIAILTTDSSGLTTQPAAATLLWPDAATRKIRARVRLDWLLDDFAVLTLPRIRLCHGTNCAHYIPLKHHPLPFFPNRKVWSLLLLVISEKLYLSWK